MGLCVHVGTFQPANQTQQVGRPPSQTHNINPGGYTGDFFTWWEQRPGRGRPKKSAVVPLAYAIPSSAGRANRQAAMAAAAAVGGRAKGKGEGAGKKKAGAVVKKRGGSKGGKGKKPQQQQHKSVQRARAAAAAAGESSSSEDWDGSSTSGEETESEEEGAWGARFCRTTSAGSNVTGTAQGSNTTTTSRSGRVIRPPVNPYLVAVEEEDGKRARIEAALAMVRRRG